MSKRASKVPADLWQRHKEEILSLYLDLKGTLSGTIALMKERHGFEASTNQYRAKLNEWGVAKYARAGVWPWVENRVRRRDQEGKKSQVFLYGQEQSREKVLKEISRHPASTSTLSAADAPTPEGVAVVTPHNPATPESDAPGESVAFDRSFTSTPTLSINLADEPADANVSMTDQPPSMSETGSPRSSGTRPPDDGQQEMATSRDQHAGLVRRSERDDYQGRTCARTFRGHCNSTATTAASENEASLHILFNSVLRVTGDRLPQLMPVVMTALWSEKVSQRALLAVIDKKNLCDLELSIANGANVNPLPLQCEATPLQRASANGWLEGVTYLLKSGARVNAAPGKRADDFSFTALRWAIENNDVKMTDLLLDNQATLSPFSGPGNDYFGALYFSLNQEKDPRIIGLLLRRGSKVHGDGILRLALDTAMGVPCEDFRVYKLILDLMGDMWTESRLRALRQAWNKTAHIMQMLEAGTTMDILGALLDAGADINWRNGSSRATCLQEALRYGPDEDISWFLLVNGADFKVPACADIGTPLQEAIEKGYEFLAIEMLRRGADPHAEPNARGCFALQAAVIKNMELLAKKILELTHSHEARSWKVLELALRDAARHGRLEIMKALLPGCPDGADMAHVCSVVAGYAVTAGHNKLADWVKTYPLRDESMGVSCSGA